MFSDTVIGIIIGSAVTSVVGPIILLLAQRIANKDQDATSLASNAMKVANQATLDLATEKEASRAEVDLLKKELAMVKRELADFRKGKGYQLIVKMIPYPNKEILEAELQDYPV